MVVAGFFFPFDCLAPIIESRMCGIVNSWKSFFFLSPFFFPPPLFFSIPEGCVGEPSQMV